MNRPKTEDKGTGGGGSSNKILFIFIGVGLVSLIVIPAVGVLVHKGSKQKRVLRTWFPEGFFSEKQKRPRTETE